MTVRCWVVAAVLLGVGGASARAQEPGVTYDRDSPAGKQYALPLDAARSVGSDDPAPAAPASGGGGTSAGGGQRFGAGITAAGGGSRSRPPAGDAPAMLRMMGVEPAGDVRSVAARADSEQLELGLLLAGLAVAAAACAGYAARRVRRTPT